MENDEEREYKPRHTWEELEQLREEFGLWYFQVEKGDLQTQSDWAVKHGVTKKTVTNWKKRPEFLAKMEEFRKTYREDGDAALQNLFRFALSPEPRVAIPAIRIVVDVMGYTSPIKVEHTARGLGLMEYLAHVGQQAIKEFTDNGGEAPALLVVDPWVTADTSKLN